MRDIVDIYSYNLQDVCIGKVVLTVSNDTDSSVGYIQVRETAVTVTTPKQTMIHRWRRGVA